MHTTCMNTPCMRTVLSVNGPQIVVDIWAYCTCPHSKIRRTPTTSCFALLLTYLFTYLVICLLISSWFMHLVV